MVPGSKDNTLHSLWQELLGYPIRPKGKIQISQYHQKQDYCQPFA